MSAPRGGDRVYEETKTLFSLENYVFPPFYSFSDDGVGGILQQHP
jgi:hypothetical protein